MAKLERRNAGSCSTGISRDRNFLSLCCLRKSLFCFFLETKPKPIKTNTYRWLLPSKRSLIRCGSGLPWYSCKQSICVVWGSLIDASERRVLFEGVSLLFCCVDAHPASTMLVIYMESIFRLRRDAQGRVNNTSVRECVYFLENTAARRWSSSSKQPSSERVHVIQMLRQSYTKEVDDDDNDNNKFVWVRLAPTVTSTWQSSFGLYVFD